MRTSIPFITAALASISLAAPAVRILSVLRPSPAEVELQKRDQCWDENFNYGWWGGHYECSGNQFDLVDRPMFNGGTCQMDADTIAYGESIGRNAC